MKMNRFNSEIFNLQVRTVENSKDVFIEGMAYKYDTLGVTYVYTDDMQKIREKISKGAAKRSLENNDIKCRWLHDSQTLLGRTSAKTFFLEEREDGLFYSLKVPNTQLGRDVLELVTREDVKGASVGFRYPKYEFTKEGNEIIGSVLDMDLVEVSIVYDPYYDSSSVGATREVGQDVVEEYNKYNKDKYSELDINLLIAINKNHEKE